MNELLRHFIFQQPHVLKCSRIELGLASDAGFIWRTGWCKDGGWNVGNDQIFALASLTKPLVSAMLAALAVQNGVLSLEAPVSYYLPRFPYPGNAIHLLTHTSGLPEELLTETMTEQDFIDWLSSVPLVEPGRNFAYSDVGYFALGRLIEKILGCTLQEAFKTLVVEPLGLKNTQLMSSSGHTGLSASAADLLRLLEIWTSREPTLLKSTVRAKFLTDHTACLYPSVATSFALGWWLRGPRSLCLARRAIHFGGDLLGERSFGHVGTSGVSCWHDPDRKLTLIILTDAGEHGCGETSLVTHAHIANFAFAQNKDEWKNL